MHTSTAKKPLSTPRVSSGAASQRNAPPRKRCFTHGATHSVAAKEKKRTFRQLWTVKINAAIRPEGMNYSTFIAALKKAGIKIDRKILADLAEHEPEVFKKVVAATKTK